MADRPQNYKKATKIEVEQRITDIMKMLISAASRQQILQHCADKYDISHSMTDRYINRASQRIVEDYQRAQTSLLARNQRLRDQILMKALTSGQLNTAVSVLRDIDRYAGNEPTQRLKVTFDERVQAQIEHSLANANEEQLQRIAGGEDVLEVLGQQLAGVLPAAVDNHKEVSDDLPDD